MFRTPPQATNTNNESVYPCDICRVTDKRPIVCCDGCNLWFHFECVNAPNDVADYDWFCIKCRQIDSSSGQTQQGNTQSNPIVMERQELANTSTNPFVNDQLVSTSTVDTSTSRQPITLQPSGADDQQLMKFSPSRKAKSNRTSSSQRKSLALQRLEEERKMELEEAAKREKQNKEYLDKKYSILELESSDDERFSLTFDDEEVNRLKQITESIKRWTQDVKSKTQMITTEANVNDQTRNNQVDTTKQQDPMVVESSWIEVPAIRAQHESSPVVNRQSNGENEVYVPVSSMANQESSVHVSRLPNNKSIADKSTSKVPSKSNVNPSQVENESISQDVIVRRQNDYINQLRQLHGVTQIPLKNYGVFKYQKPQRNFGNSNESPANLCKNPWCSEHKMCQGQPNSMANKTIIQKPMITTVNSQPAVGYNETFITNSHPSATAIQSKDLNSQVNLNHPPVMSTSVQQSSRINNGANTAVQSQVVVSDYQPKSTVHQSIFSTQELVIVRQQPICHTSASYQQANASSYQPVQPVTRNQNYQSTGMPGQTNSNGQPVIVSMPPVNKQRLDSGQRPNDDVQWNGFESDDDNQPDAIDSREYQGNIRQNELMTMQNIMSRQVIDKKLPIFSGNPEEWNSWYNRYTSTTAKCNLDDSENLDRLEKCLKGKARDIVKSKLGQTESVPWIISTLQKVFGRPEIVLKAVMKRIGDIPPIKSDNLRSLMEFAFEVQSISTTIEASGLLNQYRNPMLLEQLVEKLPAREKMDWAKYTYKEKNITIKTFTDWLDMLADVISTVVEPTVDKYEPKKSEKNDKQKAYVNVHVDGGKPKLEGNNSSESSQSQKKFSCSVCGKNCQNLENCSTFNGLTLDGKWKEIKKQNICRICLKRHRFPCKSTTVCGVNGCVIKHHRLMHNDTKQSPTQNLLKASNHVHHEMSEQVMLKYMPVVLHKGNKSIATFAFLDDGSQASMVEQSSADELGVSGTKEEICLLWTENIHRKEEAQRISIEISGISDSCRRYPLNGIRAVKSLQLPPQTLNLQDLRRQFPHLAKLPMDNYKNAVPGILIASDLPKLGIQLDVVEGENFVEPIAQRTRLGWSVYGPNGGQTESFHVNNHHIIRVCPHHNQFDQEIHQQVKEYFSIENFGVRANSKTELESKDNQRAIEMLKNLTKFVDGRYETGLLWKNDEINKSLPDSYPMAMKRLISLEKQGENVVKQIGEKIDDYVAKGYARKLSAEEFKKLGENVWFLPVFGVFHPKKPEKLRMVFDGAAKVKSISLNSMLLTGPDELASLVDILRRLREHLIGVGGDIKEMFHQIKVQRNDQRYQLFLYRNGDGNKKPDVYAMEVLIFGSKSSPAAAQFVKNINANKFKETHPRAVEAIIDNHYVDDMMDGQNSIEKAIEMIKDVAMIHARGGFEIRNFISNSPEVLKAMGSTNACDGKELSLHSELKTERVLGMWWNTKLDVFTFSLKYTLIAKDILDGTKMPTKRELLRTLMSIFDPLGLLSNYLVQLKILLQDVWRLDLNWDEQISSSSLVAKWKQWLGYLPLVESVQVPRLYSLKLVSDKTKTIEIHTFVDASVDAFAAVSYLRIENEDGIDCALMGSKARVAPLKYLSIPRKELQSAVLGARLMLSISEAQRFTIDRRVFWSDSETALSWLKSDHRKYSQFVAHRVGEILDNTDVNEWRWVPTKENIADEATKWSKSMNFSPSNRWFSGPEFLLQNESEWPKKRVIKSNVEEEMKSNFIHTSLVLPKIIDPKRFSKWNRMVRAVAYAIRFRKVFTDKNCRGTALNQEELTRAEILLFSQAQFEGFPSEMVTLIRNESLPVDKKKFIEKPSPLYDGTPFLDGDRIMRMRNRTDGARDLSMASRRPIILPRDSRITRLLIQHYHAKYLHQNHNTVINEIRQKFYIPRLRVVLKGVRSECQRCKVRKAPIMAPQMADLPQERLATFSKPFSYTGIDYFGPMTIKIGRRTEKRWGVIFTCLTIRAVHLDLAPGLDSDSCIKVIRNFVSDRGQVIEFHSDWGTNFRGANNELKRELEKLDPEKLKTEFTSTYTRWIFNPPASPHMGGSWERLIRSVKCGLYEVIPTRTPREDTLRNILKEIQNIINSRPLTYIPLETEDDEALTPNHFLHGSSNGMKPPCDIEINGEYLRKSWKEAQRLTELFWRRFIAEYLPTIARRTKWHKQVKPISPNDLVLVVDEKNPRNVYPRARVLEAPIGSNGQVRRARIELIAEAKMGPDGKIIKVRKNEIWRPAHKLAVLDVLSQQKDSLAQPILDRKTGGRMLETNVNTGTRRSARIAQKSGNTN